MTSEDRILTENEGLIRSTTYKVASKFKQSRHIGNMDDFLSEARVAAWKAIKTHDVDKKAKLSTYIVRCVTNRLIDLDRTANRACRPSLELTETGTVPAPVTSPQINFGSFLTKKEHEILKKIYMGYSIRDLVTEIHRKRKVPKRKASDEVVKCLVHIRQKLTFKEPSRNSVFL